jgi:hypothetical protein
MRASTGDGRLLDEIVGLGNLLGDGVYGVLEDVALLTFGCGQRCGGGSQYSPETIRAWPPPALTFSQVRHPLVSNPESLGRIPTMATSYGRVILPGCCSNPHRSPEADPETVPPGTAVQRVTEPCLCQVSSVNGAGSGSGTAAASQGWPANSWLARQRVHPSAATSLPRTSRGARAAGPGGAVDPLHSEPSSIRNVILKPLTERRFRRNDCDVAPAGFSAHRPTEVIPHGLWPWRNDRP